MSQWPLALLAALCGTVVLAAGLGSPIENTRAPIEKSRATSVTARAERVDAPQATALSEDIVSVTDISSSDAALTDPRPMPPPATPPVRIASLSTPDPLQNEAKEPASSVEVADIGSSGGTLLDPHPMPKSPDTVQEPVDRREQPVADVVDRREQPAKPKKASAKQKPKKLTAKPNKFVQRRTYYSYSKGAARPYR